MNHTDHMNAETTPIQATPTEITPLEQAQFLRSLAIEFKDQLSTKEVKSLVVNAANIVVGKPIIALRRSYQPAPKNPRVNLRAARLERYMLHKHVAEAVGISRCYYTMIENGQKSPSLYIARKIAGVVDCEVSDVLWVDKPTQLYTA